MPDLQEAFSKLAERHPATEPAAAGVGRRAARRRRHRTLVVTSAIALVLVLAAGTALAVRPDPGAQVDVAGTVPSTEPPATTEPPGTTSTTFAPDDLRSRLPSPARPVHVRVSGLAIARGAGPVEVCSGPMRLPRPPSCRGPVIAGMSVEDLRSITPVEEQQSSAVLVVWGPASVQGWFDGATITPDAPVVAWHEGKLPGSTFTAGGPSTTYTAEQQMAVVNDLVAAGMTEWGGVAGGTGTGPGLSILVPWADQALVELLATRHPGIVITLTAAMVPV